MALMLVCKHDSSRVSFCNQGLSTLKGSSVADLTIAVLDLRAIPKKRGIEYGYDFIDANTCDNAFGI